MRSTRLPLPDVVARRPWLIVSLFFLLLLVLGLSIYPDYGVSIDEPVSRKNGMITLRHLMMRFNPEFVAKDPAFQPYEMPLMEYIDRDYGVAFETPVSYLERVLHLDTTKEQYLFRHLATFLVCWAGCIGFYQLARRRFNSWKWGLLGALWLVLSPRLFAESFYNDKDAVFMALFAIAMNTGVQFILRPGWTQALWHALACAITIDVRIMGVLLPAATLAILVLRVLYGEISWRRALGTTLIYVLVMTGLVVLLWPYLWSAPWENFRQAFHNMSVFRWDGQVLYFGTGMFAKDLPWHYAFVWMGITTPLLYVIPFLLGLPLILTQAVRRLRAGGLRLWGSEQELQDLLFLGLWLAPLLAILVLHSIIYDGWRQLYFVYPAALLVALRGAYAIWHWRPRLPRWAKRWPQLVGGVAVVSMLTLVAQMVAAHPLQNVYFNLLAGDDVPHRFEMDYWSLSYRQGLEYVLANDSRPKINCLLGEWSSGDNNRFLLTPEEQNRLVFVNKIEEADYLITAYRGHQEEYEFQQKEIYQVRAFGRRVLSVFKLRW
ncbi:ArnT family glycosyltransferase [Hymenobacter fodinae]|uniref:Dolichyl-phosphate-mannose-protein mannosyltransferase n=1 Tax=Hymenobacter fodinae TaxID=2510796 RepID=A0A4Z0P2C6_9BACT|nr:hypothetical protein [Hymenobacter fodinae]TGE05494.1 hypothetical protein EU556_19520 [Hymenobacter fodinae]